jgi:hypothetical protein
MQDTSHLSALNVRLANELSRLSRAVKQSEKDMRAVWIKQIEKEIADERAYLGMPPEKPVSDMTDDELLAALSA